jgi:hypothetical protein
MKPLITSQLSSPAFALFCAVAACVSPTIVYAQDPSAPPKDDISTTEAPPVTAPTTENGAEANGVPTETAAETTKSKLTAEKVSYEGSIVIGEGTPEKPVRFESSVGTVTAQTIRLDTVQQTVEAKGEVVLERKIKIIRQELRNRKLEDIEYEETFTETARGNNLTFDFKNRTGSIDTARIEIAQASIEASQLLINGERYTAKDVVIRPGGLTPQEIKIYGTPPFNLRAREVTATTGAKPGDERLIAKGGTLYFKSTRLFPVPSYAFKIGGREKDPTAPSITPKISFNSADRLFVATEFLFPINKSVENPGKLDLAADIGLSQRVGFRGGLGLQSAQSFGNLAFSVRRSDVISTQLTNRIELDRKPELRFNSRPFFDFDLPGGRRAGFSLDAGIGDYTERRIGSSQNDVSSSRLSARLNFTTRLRPQKGPAVGGPYLRLFTSYARYGINDDTYNSKGYEIGYDGALFNKLRGQISLRQTDLSGETPFRFDRVEIAKELRASVDYELTPRFIVPIDLRYDIEQEKLRDKSIGLLRSYKSFAYGVVYQAARNDVRLEVRQGF